MSRIQNVLEKAERDGAIRPGRPAPAAAPLRAPAPVAAAAPAPLATPVRDDEPGALPRRVIANARLDRRLVAAAAADSAAAEQYRALRTRILHADNGSPVNVLLVTSPGRHEGKSLTAANLALTMAQEYQRRICLLDADMRHPQLHALFGVSEGPGLSDVLSGDAALDAALVAIEDQQLTMLPAGSAHGRPAELLGTAAMRRVLETLRSRFDRVVVDAPATAPLADVGILTPLVDSVILVVRAGVTTKPAIHDAVAALEDAKLLGIVLNEVE